MLFSGPARSTLDLGAVHPEAAEERNKEENNIMKQK